MTRQEINREILKALSTINETCPNLRFGQLLVVSKAILYKSENINYDLPPEVIDPFYEESQLVLDRVNKAINK